MNNDYTLLLPEMLVTALAFVILGADLFLHPKRKNLLAYSSVVGLVVISIVTGVHLWGEDEQLYEGLMAVDGYAVFFKIFFLGIAGAVVLMSIGYVRKNLEHPGEYYGILLFSVVGMMFMAAARELLTAYISLELVSFSLYALVSFDRYNPKSNEAGMKYILLGAFSSALLLYGISQIYGLLGTTQFGEINEALVAAPGLSPGLVIGMVFVVAGLAFKIAAVPFHMWAPDVYEGAPLPITAYLSVGFKSAAIALILRIFTESLIPGAEGWQVVIVTMAVLSMIVGNLGALVQRNIKRLLAYSSIAHVGYLLVGIAAIASFGQEPHISVEFSNLAINGIIFHLVAYGVTTIAAFLCIIAVHNATGTEEISGFNGLGKRAPTVAMVFTAALFSLAGLPIFAGFFSKFYLFNAAATQGLLWLAGIAIFMGMVSLYYYLMIIRHMYIEPADDAQPVQIPKATSGMLWVLLTGIIFLGVYPAPLFYTVQIATDTLLSSAGIIGMASLGQ